MTLDTKPKKILIIEDDRQIAAVLSLRLELAGYDVITAPDGFEGVKRIMGERPDLILTDIWMPVGVGFSVAQRLHELGFHNIPIIFLTGSKVEGLRETALEVGAAGFFEKPCESGALLKAIASALESSSLAEKQARRGIARMRKAHGAAPSPYFSALCRQPG